MDIKESQQIGYVIRAIEDLTMSLKAHMENEAEDRVNLLARLEAIEDEIKVKKAISAKAWRVLGFIGAVLPLLAFFKFNDIQEMWRVFINR